MQGHKKKFRKSLWLGMAFERTETPIALTTTTTFSTTTALRTTMSCEIKECGLRGKGPSGKICCPTQQWCCSKTTGHCENYCIAGLSGCPREKGDPECMYGSDETHIVTQSGKYLQNTHMSSLGVTTAK